MDEKTAELRDIFTEVTDGEQTVTESQEDTRGSIETDEDSLEDRLLDLVHRMRERYEFDHGLSDEQLLDLAGQFYDGLDDTEMANAHEVEESAIFEGRMSLHLLRAEEQSRLEGHRVADLATDDEAVATDLDVDAEAVPRIRRIAEAREQSRGANDRYRDEFDSLLSESDLSGRMASEVREDGLEDATEGMETDVSF